MNILAAVNAESWYHSFTPSFSGSVLLVTIALLALSYYFGTRAVKVLPINQDSDYLYYYGGNKAEDINQIFKLRNIRTQGKTDSKFKKADSMILFCGCTADVVWGIIAGIIFAYMFFINHWDGLVQFMINLLSPKDGAAWGDILALIALYVLGIIIGFLCYVIRLIGESRKAQKLVRAYLRMFRKPIVRQTPSIAYVAGWIYLCITDYYDEKKSEEKKCG